MTREAIRDPFKDQRLMPHRHEQNELFATL
jgi:hypothetical protein